VPRLPKSRVGETRLSRLEKPERSRMAVPFRTSRRVEFGDTDMAGIMHFANFFRFMEAAECDFLRALDLSVTLDWQGEHFGLPRVSARCDYLSPARFGDVLTIAVSVRRLGGKSVTYGFDFFKDETALARGQITAVFCRMRKDHPLEAVEIPMPFRARLTPFLVSDSAST
jgi:acyl-CoA thioester hydrolase